MPLRIHLNGDTYVRTCVFKHDFFAATGMYESASSLDQPKRIVLKLGRQQNFLGMPMKWLGRSIAQHELANLRQVSGIPGVPRVIAEYDSTGFAYQYIPGRSLDDSNDMPLGFFDKLRQLLDSVHRRNVIYLDLNKRGNILIGEDGLPYLIDFQISLCICRPSEAIPEFAAGVIKSLQGCDIYHLLKHKRRLCPHELTADERIRSCRASSSVRLHRLLTRPLTKLRRAILKALFANSFLVRDEQVSYSPEHDPARFLKR